MNAPCPSRPRPFGISAFQQWVLAFSGADGAAQPANEWVDARQAQAQHDKLLAQP